MLQRMVFLCGCIVSQMVQGRYDTAFCWVRDRNGGGFLFQKESLHLAEMVRGFFEQLNVSNILYSNQVIHLPVNVRKIKTSTKPHPRILQVCHLQLVAIQIPYTLTVKHMGYYWANENWEIHMLYLPAWYDAITLTNNNLTSVFRTGLTTLIVREHGKRRVVAGHFSQLDKIIWPPCIAPRRTIFSANYTMGEHCRKRKSTGT